jgi:uncharacterized repeat protein (TIGR01451 family)
MVPPSPNFGQVVTVTLEFCGNQQPSELAIAISSYSTRQTAGTGGQVFVVSSAGTDVPTVIFPSDPISITAFSGSGSGPYNCQDCSNDSNSVRVTRQYVFRIPPMTYFPGCDVTRLYLHVGMKDDGGGIYRSEWQGFGACETGQSVGLPLSWDIPVPPATFTMRKRAEGVVQLTNDLVLFSIDYEYGNGRPTITDVLPGAGQLTLVSYGPNPMGAGGSVTGPPIGSTSGTITWTLPDRTGAHGIASGTVWILMRANTNIGAGTNIGNTANGTMGSINRSSTANIIAGQAAITVTKIQSATTVNYGGRITYYLNYQVNGSQLKAYRPFDDIASGGYTTLAPPGWRNIPFESNYGTWTIRDDCGTADRYIYGQSLSSYGQDEYPALLLNDSNPSNVQFCTGIIMSDVMIDPVGFEGADGLVIIRSNGQTGTNSYTYSLLLSIDTAPANGYIAIQKCGGGNCEWNGGVSSYQIVGNIWYRTKIEVTQVGNNYRFRAKVWRRGDAEPTNYQLDWTTTTNDAIDANWRCTGGNWNDWRPGISEQKGASGDTRDAYDNFIVYIPRVSANTTLYDTIPAGLGSVGGSGSPTISGGMIRWNLGSLSDVSGSYTWWATVNTCDPVTNQAAIDGDNPIIPQYSNITVFTPICPQVTGITKTANVTQAGVGQTITFSITYCNTGPSTIRSYQIWDTRPARMSYVGCNGGTSCGISGSLITWNLGDVAPVGAGSCPQGTVRWWGVVQP